MSAMSSSASSSSSSSQEEASDPASTDSEASSWPHVKSDASRTSGAEWEAGQASSCVHDPNAFGLPSVTAAEPVTISANRQTKNRERILKEKRAAG